MEEIYKKWLFWAIVVLVILILAGLYPNTICHFGGGETPTQEAVKHCHNFFSGQHFH